MQYRAFLHPKDGRIREKVRIFGPNRPKKLLPHLEGVSLTESINGSHPASRMAPSDRSGQARQRREPKQARKRGQSAKRLKAEQEQEF